MLMAAIPGPALLAGEVLAAAAARAGVSTGELAQAMVTNPPGSALPPGIDRAVRSAVEAAREPAPAVGAAAEASWPRLMPSRPEVERALGRFTEARVRLTESPADDEARRAVEDSVFTLCVLMGRPSAYEAVQDAVQFTAG
ncbi:hypothetical protein SAVIM338S_00149 [Streptomyces avidinii]